MNRALEAHPLSHPIILFVFYSRHTPIHDPWRAAEVSLCGRYAVKRKSRRHRQTIEEGFISPITGLNNEMVARQSITIVVVVFVTPRPSGDFVDVGAEGVLGEISSLNK